MPDQQTSAQPAEPADALRDCIARYSSMSTSIYDARTILRWMAEAGWVVVSKRERGQTADAIDRLRGAIDAIASGKPAHLRPKDLCAVLHEAEAAHTVRAAAQGALALIEIIDAVEMKAVPVSDLSPARLGDLLNNTERALREALAT